MIHFPESKDNLSKPPPSDDVYSAKNFTKHRSKPGISEIFFHFSHLKLTKDCFSIKSSLELNKITSSTSSVDLSNLEPSNNTHFLSYLQKNLKLGTNVQFSIKFENNKTQAHDIIILLQGAVNQFIAQQEIRSVGVIQTLALNEEAKKAAEEKRETNMNMNNESSDSKDENNNEVKAKNKTSPASAMKNAFTKKAGTIMCQAPTLENFFYQYDYENYAYHENYPLSVGDRISFNVNAERRAVEIIVIEKRHIPGEESSEKSSAGPGLLSRSAHSLSNIEGLGSTKSLSLSMSNSVLNSPDGGKNHSNSKSKHSNKKLAHELRNSTSTIGQNVSINQS